MIIIIIKNGLGRKNILENTLKVASIYLTAMLCGFIRN